MLNSNIVIRPYQADDGHATLLVFDQAIRGTAAQFYDEGQIDAWAPNPEADLSAWNTGRDQAWTVVG